MSKEYNYKRKVVAFLDIMGFKKMVEKSEFDEHITDKLIRILFKLQEMKHYGDIKDKDYRKELSSFSDSIVITYNIKEGTLLDIIYDILWMQIELVEEGFLLRGGVTIGDIFHEGDVVVGPALIEAYEMESKIAVYPRIIVNPIIFDCAYENMIQFHTKEETKELLLDWLCPCENNYYYTNFLSMKEELGDDYNTLLNKINLLIERGLKETKIGVRNKYEWLQKYLLEVEIE